MFKSIIGGQEVSDCLIVERQLCNKREQHWQDANVRNEAVESASGSFQDK